MISKSNVPYTSIQSSINNDDNAGKKVVSSLDHVVEPKHTENNNKWCCFSIRLPITGKLEKGVLTWIVIILFIDAINNLLLFFTTHKWWFLNGDTLNSFTLQDLYDDFTSFHSGTSDTILLWIIRALSLFILTHIAISNGVPAELWRDKTTNKLKEASVEDVSEDIDEDDIEGIDDKRRYQPKFENKSETDLYQQRVQKCVVYKYLILLLMFLLCTFYQAYIGVKCVTFDFLSNHEDSMHYETMQAIFYGICVLCINLEIFLFKSFIESATDLGESILIKSLHPHPVKQTKKIKYWCNLCRSRAKYYTYRCNDCGFDVCSSCYKKERKRLKMQQMEQLKKQNTQQSSMKHGGKLAASITFKAASESYTYNNASAAPENDPTLELQKELTSTGYMVKAFSLCKPHAVLIFFAFSCLAINSVANLLLPRSQGTILDQIVDNNRSEFVYQIKYYVILSVIIGFFGSIRNLCFAFVIRRLTVSIRSLLFRNIMVQNIDFFDEMSTGELISRMSNDVRGMLYPLRTMLRTTLSNIILLCGGLVMCFITSWRLSMLAFTTIAPVLFLTGQYAKWSKNINRAIWAAFGSSTQIASQAFGNIRTVRAFGTEQREIKHYDNALQEILERSLIDAVASTATFALTNYLDLGAGVLILYFGGSSIFEHKSHNELTIGKLITFQLYWNMINNAYKGLQNVLTSFTSGAGAAQRVITLLDRIGNNPHHLNSGEYPEHGLDGSIFIENLHFHYKSRPESAVLNGINLEVKPGEVVAIVGRSGGGKSTLIHLLLRFYDVSKGQILYNKERMPLCEMNLTQLRQSIGLVAQDTQLFDCTIKENILYGMQHEDDVLMEEIIHCATLANCHEFIDEFEDKYDTRVGERGVRLSGGQKQRIAIARMLMKRPRILFLDEATSNLDTESEALVQAAIDKTIWYNEEDHEEKYDAKEDEKYKFKANAVILVAHRLSTVMNADKIAVIDKGKIVELGSHETLLQNKEGVYYKLVERQIQREKNQLNQTDEEKATKKTKKGNVASDDIDSLFDNND